ncbi:response regulator [Antarctobacter sp.]|uniref:response regulator n=1 Tax=Antarctobacter sp. TaxID=1872577 RepID=UPI002B264EB5|nr:response regulator [Antarctobacter sp.]
MLIEALHNGAVLGFTAIGLYLVLTYRDRSSPLTASVALGLSYGVVAFLVTVSPLEIASGATMDARAGPVVIAGIFGGPVAATIAASFGAVARWIFGGTFAFSGTIVFALYALIGSLLWLRFFTKGLDDNLTWARILLGAGLSLVAAGLMYFLIEPRDVADQWLATTFPNIASANLLSILLCGLIGKAVLMTVKQRQDLEHTLETLEIAKSAGGIGIWVVDHATGTATWDDTNKALHGIQIEGNTGRYEDWAQTLHPEDLARVADEFDAALKGEKTFDTFYRVVLPDQRVAHLKGNAVVLRNAANEPTQIVGANIDVSDLVEKDRALEESQSIAVQAQKMEAIGQLTGGVAHDFNNLLAVILGNLELIEETDSPEEIREFLDAAKTATNRGADLTKSLLSFARKSSLAPAVIDINQMVRETKNWSSRVIPENIDVEISLLAGLWRVEADPSLTQNALLNLLLNARDAMPLGGKMTIETSNVRIDEDYNQLRGEDLEPGRYVLLAVSDTGEGIPAENITQIFDPFFTTKSVGKGSGLGLSMVQGFMKQSGGAVRVYSEMATGTTVKLYFRSVAGQQDERSPQEAVDEQPSRGEARIFVVEDEEAVLEVLAKTLKKAGYHITSARSGDEALRMWDKGSSFDLLVTDIVMPGDLQGTQLARELRARHPELPVVFMSGYASEATVHGNGLRPEDIRLMKPVRRKDLIAAVEKALGTGD